MSNRIIKFRVWDKKLNKFKASTVVKDNGLVGVDCKNGIFTLNFSTNKNYIVQQFTGLLDRNKKEIYEGDVITHDQYDGYAIVDWDKFYNSFCLKYILKDKRMKPVLEPLSSDLKLKIIGNIMETPELLK